MRVDEATLKCNTYTLRQTTSRMPEFVDITDRVADFLYESQIRNGFVVVFSKHTTAAITIQENEPLLINDMASLLDRLSPRSSRYGHNDFSIRTVNLHEDECPNGHSHCQHLILGSSESIPVVDGGMTLGQFQRIFMVELDDDDRKEHREIVVQILGV